MPAGAQRDPLSVRFDPAARRVLLAAIRAHKIDPKRPRSARIWVPSRLAEFRDLDPGGRTKSERAFTRSIYYQTDKSGPKVWSAKLVWFKRTELHGTRRGRYVRVRLFLAKSGSNYAQRLPASQSWQESEARSYVTTGGPMPDSWMRQRRRAG